MDLRSRFLCRATILGTLVATSVPGVAYAQATTSGRNESIDVTDIHRTCSGEFVEVEGSDHVVTHHTLDAAGGIHSVSHDNFQGVGGVSSTGVRYREVGARQDEHFNSTAGGAHVAIEPVRNNNLISQGPDANAIAHFVDHRTYNANGEVTADFQHTVSGCIG